MSRITYNFDKEVIKDAFKNGVFTKELSQRYKCTPDTIRKFCSRNSIKVPRIGIKDLSNYKFNYFTVEKQLPSENQKRLWLCKCKCGNLRILDSSEIQKGARKSCGCFHIDNRKNPKIWKGYGDIHGFRWAKIQRSALSRNIEFDISIQYAWDVFCRQGGKCIFSGLRINFAKTVREYRLGNHTASLDRLDNTKGYIKGNIAWVHKDINKMKHIFSIDKFLYLCKCVGRNIPNVRGQLLIIT